MSYRIESKAGLIGYLQGSIRGTVNTMKNATEYGSGSKADLERYLKVTLEQLEKVLVESENIWQDVKGN